MAVKLSPVYLDAQFINGVPAVGAKLFTYAAGSTTKQATYSDSSGLVANSNPIILNARGEPPAIWLSSGQTYKFILASPTDTDPPTSPIRTIDNISGVNDTSINIDEWIASGLSPTYLNATQFTLLGDQTSDFQVNRRIKLLISAGVVYGYISAVTYTTNTTVTVVLDAGTLDTGLSQVSLGLLSATSPSVPSLIDTLFRIIKSSALNISARFDAALLSVSRVYTLPDKNGTVAMISDLPTVPDLASQAEAEAGTDNVKYLSSLRTKQSIDFNLNRTGTAPMFACRAWVNFDGTLSGTIAPRGSGNVSSVTKNGTGDYTINFITNMADVTYCVQATFGNGSLAGAYSMNAPFGTPTVSGVRIGCANVATPPVLTDAGFINVAIFR